MFTGHFASWDGSREEKSIKHLNRLKIGLRGY